MRSILLYLSIIICFFVLIPSQIQTFAFIQNQSPGPGLYTNQGHTSNPVQKVKTAKKQSLLSKIESIAAAAVLGSTGVVLGAFLARYSLYKKRRAFDIYYKQITQAQELYKETLISNNGTKEEAGKKLEENLMHIQEQAELNAARKKLDPEQLTAISNKIQRIIDETAHDKNSSD